MNQNAFLPARVQSAVKKLYQQKNVALNVLRLDEIHPVISGNKWFKLKAYVKDALVQNKKNIITFGGAFSNHIIATAAAANLYRLQSIGIIRGEEPEQLSSTLLEAKSYGMQLFFVSREAYKRKELPNILKTLLQPDDVYIIGEGGYGKKGAEGAADILTECDAGRYTHIMAAVGTGTMLAGLVAASKPTQTVIGISSLKNHLALTDEVQALLKDKRDFKILHDYHFGGYAKAPAKLFDFMNSWYKDTGIPTDMVYTSKLFYAIDDLIEKDFFPPGSKILAIHSGGLQGNRSLPKGTLIFS